MEGGKGGLAFGEGSFRRDVFVTHRVLVEGLHVQLGRRHFLDRVLPLRSLSHTLPRLVEQVYETLFRPLDLAVAGVKSTLIVLVNSTLLRNWLSLTAGYAVRI